MAYNEKLAERVRQALTGKRGVEEKRMFGGLAFMINQKMSIGIVRDDLMLRIDPAIYDAALRRKGCREMDFTGKPMKGFVFVSLEGVRTKKNLEHWMQLALEFNKKARRQKREKKK